MRTIDDLDVAGKKVLVRADLNVPLQDGAITDDGRIRASLPTIEALRAKGAKVIVCAHLGRPKGQVKPEFSLAPVAKRLGELLGADVAFASDVVGDSARAAAEASRTAASRCWRTCASSRARPARTTPSGGALADRLAALAEIYVGTGSAPCTASTRPSTTCRSGSRTPPLG